ncbi:MAG TPA: hypothetical protein VGB54_11030 [Allosphingosinicella sp.]
MQIALLQLHLGWRFGVDGRTERALLRRGLIEMRPYSATFPELPVLTPAGSRAAKAVWLSWPIAQKQAVRREMANWGLDRLRFGA